jgi:hypothetical protein
MDIKFEIENFTLGDKKLIRKDGRINSPIIARFKKSDLYNRILEITFFLPSDATLSQRWWHIKNDLYKYKKCSCGKLITTWGGANYFRFCSHICALTSEENKERARKTSTGRKFTNEQCRAISLRMIGHKVSLETKNILSKSKMGELNPHYGKPSWNRGLFGPLNPLYGKKYPNRKVLRGRDNPMYGKSPSVNAGKGIHGHFTGFFYPIHFRSSLELFYLMYWYENNIQVESAETAEFEVQYFDNGNYHIYRPDFFLIYENTLVELKPEKMQEMTIVIKKFETLKACFENMSCKLCGFSEIGPFIKDAIINDKIKRHISLYNLIISDKQLNRLIRNYSVILREVDRNTKLYT